ncbi:chemotaxis protein CheW [Archaeoglobus veneficus]|uniref:CheW protein n=1 Tax=Archaeoglobus veneficus (strain DSM 11195 / SNP6) TaxID=693661 RepID=F2KQK1_ARCVS|nr:chemotaxis protein CheW [Archaeoglobus veneficus]AEA47734.1 CheW protein [Archaeoglobus veneficus SNP6]
MAGIDKVVKFKLGNGYFAISVNDVKEVVKVQNITRIPNAPPHVEGIMDLRGEVCTIIDPKVLLNVDSSEVNEDKQRIIVLDVGKSVGIKVDEVISVDDVLPDQLEDATELGEYAKAIIKDRINDRVELILWLDVEKLVQGS